MLNKTKKIDFDMEEEDFEDNKELSHEGNVRCGYISLLLYLEEMSLLVASIKACAKPSI